MSGTALEYVDTDVAASFGDCRLNSDRIIRLLVRIDPFFHTCVHYLPALRSRLEPASDIILGSFMRPVVVDKCVKFRDPQLNGSGEMQL